MGAYIFLRQPIHFGHHRRIFIVVVSQAIIPSVRISVKAGAAEIDTSLYIWGFSQKFKLGRQLIRVFPGGILFIASVNAVPNINMTAIAVMTPPFDQFLVICKLMSYFPIKLGSYIVNPSVLQP